MHCTAVVFNCSNLFHKEIGLYYTVSACARLAQLVRFPTANQEVPAWSRVKLLMTFFRHTVRGQGRYTVGLVSQHSIVGHIRTHALVDRSKPANAGVVIGGEGNMGKYILWK